MFRFFLLIAVNVFVFSCAHAMTFDEVWKLAVHDNPGRQAAVYSYNAQIEQAKQARSALLPSLVFDGSALKNKSDGTFTSKNSVKSKYSENYDSLLYTIKFVQPVIRIESFIGYEESKKYPEIGKVLVKKTNDELFAAVLEAFANVLFNKEYLNVTISKKNSIAEQMNDLEKRFELGDATITDLTEAKARYDLVLAEEIAVNNAYSASKKILAILANMPGSEIDADDLQEQLFSETELKPMEYWLNKSAENNSEIQYKKIELQIAELILRKEKTRSLPTLDFMASYTNKDNNGDINGVGEKSEVTSFGLNLRVPLIQGGSVIAGINEKTQLKYKTINELAQLRLDVASTISNVYSNILSTHARITAYETALESAKLAVTANEKGFSIGTRTNIDLLDAKEQYFKVKKDYYQNRLSFILSYFNLLTVSGLLTEHEIGQIR